MTYDSKTFGNYLFAEAMMIIKGWFFLSFSQNGEDVIVDKLLGNKKRGFYVDVGAYDPTRLSNTKRFYLKGWKGVNIEPDPANFEKFRSERKRDINLNLGIGRKSSGRTFYQFSPKTISTFSHRQAKEYTRQGYKLIAKEKVKTETLSNLFTKFNVSKIDFLSVDTEGYEIEVLRSNDWKKFVPKIICIEVVDYEVGRLRKRSSVLEKYLNRKGYKKYLDNGINAVFLFGKT